MYFLGPEVIPSCTMWEDECQDSYDIGRNKDEVYSQKEKVNRKYNIPNCFPAGWGLGGSHWFFEFSGFVIVTV